MPSLDPRCYVKAAPLPIASQKGLRVQARSAKVFNLTSPSREEVRKWNYDRRQQQMKEQGFKALNYKPYKGVGDPFYLDEKRLILQGLGQLDQEDDLESTLSSELDDDLENTSEVLPKETLSTAKFVLKRTRKDLNTLGTEVAKGRQLIRNVSLGHSLFELIKHERLAKKAALLAEKQRALEEARNQWQLPKSSSDDEDSEVEDVEIDSRISLPDYLSDDLDLDFLLPESSSSCRTKTVSSRSRSGKNKKQMTPRPFTPLYNNLLEITERKDEISSEALFRQLCALDWILEAMNLEQGCTMGPISTCWSRLVIGGVKIPVKKMREERRAEADWEKFLSNQLFGRVNKASNFPRLNRLSRSSRLLSHPRASTQSRSVSPSSSSSIMNSLTTSTMPVAAHTTLHRAQQTSLHPAPTINQAPSPGHKDSLTEGDTVTSIDEAEEEILHRTGIFKFLDEYYDSLKREEERNKETGQDAVTSQAESGQGQSGDLQDQHSRKRTRDNKSAKKSKPTRDDVQDQVEVSKSDGYRKNERFFLKELRNNLNHRSKSSPELLEFHANKASIKYANLRQDLQDKFKEIHDDKAMTLHDVLEQMDRARFLKCQTKFGSLATRSSDFYRVVKEMRQQEVQVLAQPDVARRSSVKSNWYTELLMNLPEEAMDIWYYQVIMQKIGRYGLVENTSKQSVYKFLKVLEGLRHWEICSPDISAAVEFCRSKIVEMSVEEYEEWFSQAFPKIQRPKTAPADLTVQNNKAHTKSEGEIFRGSAENSGGKYEHLGLSRSALLVNRGRGANTS